MKRTWTIIGVNDVHVSYRWYQSLFGQPQRPPAHDDFGQILDSDGTVLICLHLWGAHEHPPLMGPGQAPPGNGLLLFFRVDDYEMTLTRARALVDRFEEEPHLNPSTRTLEFSLRDPFSDFDFRPSDSNTVAIISPRSDAIPIERPVYGHGQYDQPGKVRVSSP